MEPKEYSAAAKGRWGEEHLAAVAERRRKVREFRESGKKDREIAELLGISEGVVQKDLARMRKAGSDLGPLAARLRDYRHVYRREAESDRTPGQKALRAMMVKNPGSFMVQMNQLEVILSGKVPAAVEASAGPEVDLIPEVTEEWLNKNFKVEWEVLRGSLVSGGPGGRGASGGGNVEGVGDDPGEVAGAEPGGVGQDGDVGD